MRKLQCARVKGSPGGGTVSVHDIRVHDPAKVQQAYDDPPNKPPPMLLRRQMSVRYMGCARICSIDALVFLQG